MSTLSSERWRAVSPYLDRALTMPEAERAKLLAQLFAENPVLAGDLKTLLQEHNSLTRKGYLEEPLPIPHPPTAREGEVVGAYTLISPIGEGGMGTVWLARRSDDRFERSVAVKFPRTALLGVEGQKRFKTEGSILGRLSHPHIANLLDAGVAADGQAFLILEHVDGEPIDRYCDRLGLDVRERVRLFIDVLAAVAHAHANLIVHRDLKPSNVFVTTDGHVKLLDFGIARLLEDGESSAIQTQRTYGPMTPAYAAPEQLTNAPVTTATDVYTLGVLLYVLLAGQHPAGEGPLSPAELVRAVVETEPPHPSTVISRRASSSENVMTIATARATSPEKLRHLLRGDLDTIVAKALKKAPHERYLSATAFAEDLNRYLRHEPVRARPDSPAYRAAKFARRNRTGVMLAAVTLVAVVVGVTATLLQARKVRMERDFAIRQLVRAEAIQDLDSFLLSDAAPSGRPFTVTDLMARAEQIIDRQQGAAATRAELLISMGLQYVGLDELDNARRVLEKAYLLSRTTEEPSVRAKAAAAWGRSLAYADPPRAEQLYREGIEELPNSPPFEMARIFCLLRGGSISRAAGRYPESIERIEAARNGLRQLPAAFQLQEIGASISLAETFREMGRNRDAIAAYERIFTQMRTLGRDRTQTAGTVLNNWALALDASGRKLEAEKVFRRAIEISRDDRGEEAVAPMLLLNYGRTLKALGRLDDAADYADRAYAGAVEAGNDVVINQSLLERNRIYRMKGELAKADTLLLEVESRFQRVLPPEHFVFCVVASERSLLAQARGDLDEALRLANRAVAMMEVALKVGGAQAVYLPTFLRQRSEIETLLGMPDEAVADARRAVDAIQEAAEPGTSSSNLGYTDAALGRALRAQGKESEAQQAFQSAAEQLERALGPDHPDSRAMRELTGPAAQ